MRHRSATVAGALALGGLVIAAALAPRPAPAQALSGLDLFRTRCDGCHELPDPEAPKRPRQMWEQIVGRMVRVRGAILSPVETKALLNYLDSFNREPRQIRWVEGPAKSRKVVFSPGDAGKLPAEWVDLTIGADEPIPWAVQGDAAGKSAYVSPLKAAEESQFPALIDNTGLVQDGSATARLQIVSGKGTPAAGLIFGFRNAQSYFGVRLSPRDVILYEVQGGQRALRARAPQALALKQWHTVSVEISGKAVRVSLNGKPVPELARALEAYRGGRLGLHTQGDTIALFEQWEVGVR